MARACNVLYMEVGEALKKHAIHKHPTYGKIYAFEVDGYGNQLCMDDANIPSLLALPYICDVKPSDRIYQNTRKYLLSLDNPYFFQGQICRRHRWPSHRNGHGVAHEHNHTCHDVGER
mgnify:FL=1